VGQESIYYESWGLAHESFSQLRSAEAHLLS